MFYSKNLCQFLRGAPIAINISTFSLLIMVFYFMHVKRLYTETWSGKNKIHFIKIFNENLLVNFFKKVGQLSVFMSGMTISNWLFLELLLYSLNGQVLR